MTPPSSSETSPTLSPSATAIISDPPPVPYELSCPRPGLGWVISFRWPGDLPSGASTTAIRCSHHPRGALSCPGSADPGRKRRPRPVTLADDPVFGYADAATLNEKPSPGDPRSSHSHSGSRLVADDPFAEPTSAVAAVSIAHAGRPGPQASRGAFTRRAGTSTTLARRNSPTDLPIWSRPMLPVPLAPK